MKRFIGSIAFVVVAGLGLSARAAVPAGYTGTPFKGTAKPIPGRIELIDYDLGGAGVGFQTVHQGDVTLSGPEYRADRPAPTLCRTFTIVNSFNDKPDTYVGGPLNGTFYPSTDASKPEYYIGAIRPGDWVKVTVNVATAGTYTISSHWTSPAANIDFQIYFNDVLKNETKAAATGSYHNWVPFPNFATVQLDAGIQVMKFVSVQEHLNLGYVEFALAGDAGVTPAPEAGVDAAVTPEAGTGGTAGAGGATGTGGTTTVGGSGGAGGTIAAGGASGSTATGGAGGSTATGGTGGATQIAGAGGTTVAGAAGTTAPVVTETSTDTGGCACTVGAHSRSGIASILLAALAALGIARRRRR
jgi:MYXO-CTERM domain-containing protein